MTAVSRNNIDELLEIVQSTESALSGLHDNPLVRASDSSIRISLSGLESDLELSKKIVNEISYKTNSAQYVNFEQNFEPVTDELNKVLNKTTYILNHCINLIDGDYGINGETIAAIASLINIARSIIKDIIQLFEKKLDFYKKAELIRLQYEEKTKLTKFKIELEQSYKAKEALNATPNQDPNAPQGSKQLLPWTTEQILSVINEEPKRLT